MIKSINMLVNMCQKKQILILISHKLPDMNNRDVADPNNFGKLCMPNNLCMLNGRNKGDGKGNFTNYSYKGSSVIDYGIISKSLFPTIVYFKVHSLSFFQVIVHFHLLCGPNSSNSMMITIKNFYKRNQQSLYGCQFRLLNFKTFLIERKLYQVLTK